MADSYRRGERVQIRRLVVRNITNDGERCCNIAPHRKDIDVTDNAMNGWNQWSKHVLAELKRGGDERKQIRNEVASVRKDIATLRTEQRVLATELRLKASLWGAAAAAVPTIGAILFVLLK